jgi:putative transcriptional regulator
MERQKVQIGWQLRKVMASRDVWNATDLRELLSKRARYELSLQAVSALIRNQPVQMKTETLQALCTALKCTPDELYGVVPPREVSLTDEPNAGDPPAAR